jgi:hypothetical protein
VHVRIHPDPLSGPPKEFTVQLSHPHAVHLSTTSITITLTDAQQSGSSSLVLSSALPSLTLFP